MRKMMLRSTGIYAMCGTIPAEDRFHCSNCKLPNGLHDIDCRGGAMISGLYYGEKPKTKLRPFMPFIGKS